MTNPYGVNSALQASKNRRRYQDVLVFEKSEKPVVAKVDDD